MELQKQTFKHGRDKMNLHQIQKHPEYVEGCFGCKLGTLQLSPGDANSRASMPLRKWEGELQAYRDARKEGIQPAGTTMKKIVEAKEASENLGRAYNAEKDPNARKINKKTAQVMKELGA